MDSLFIFGAKYLFILSPLILTWTLYKEQVKRREMLISFTLVFILSYVVALISRGVYFNPRPFAIEGFEPLIPHLSDNGFPSDHTLFVGAIASGMMFYRKRLAIYLWLITLVVGISRVYVGVHHCIDIVGSVMITLASAGVVHVLLKKLKNGTMNPTNITNGKH